MRQNLIFLMNGDGSNAIFLCVCIVLGAVANRGLARPPTLPYGLNLWGLQDHIHLMIT